MFLFCFVFVFRKRRSWMDDLLSYEPFLRVFLFLFVLFLSCLDATDYMTSMELQN